MIGGKSGWYFAGRQKLERACHIAAEAIKKGEIISPRHAECLSRGNACAAMAIGRVGAREAVPTREELEMFLAARGGVELRGRDGAES